MKTDKDNNLYRPLIKQRKETALQMIGLYSLQWRGRWLLPAARYTAHFFVNYSLQTMDSFSAIFKATHYVTEAIIVKGMQH